MMPLNAGDAAAEAGSGAVDAWQPQLFRFGLRRLLGFVSAVVVLAALLARLDGAWPLVIAGGVALVSAHVFGGFVGTRLRDSQPILRRSAPHDAPNRRLSGAPGPSAEWPSFTLPETTPLADRPAARLNRLPLATGMAAGLLAGGGALYVIDEHITWFGLTLGAVSCGVTGSWVALLASSFFSISRHAWRHATRSLPRRS